MLTVSPAIVAVVASRIALGRHDRRFVFEYPWRRRSRMDRAQALAQETRAAGFAAMGVCAPDAIPLAPERLRGFLEAGRHGDMAWMAEFHQPDIGILACGGHYTMDMERAAWAARKWFNFRWVIPCHYRTFPLLEQTADALRAGVPPGVRVIEPQVLEPAAI